jgi:large subunit ribosomal protein L22
MIMKSTIRFARISPTKARRAAKLISGKSVEDALDLLGHWVSKPSRMFKKTLLSAIANAENNANANRKELWVSCAKADCGPSIKRSRPQSKGRRHPILKRTSHLVVELKATKETGKRGD